MTLSQSSALSDPHDFLRRFWGYPDFRDPQSQVVESLLSQTDTLAILPTGMGKSLCFQVPALMQQGLTLVISPLVSLMENQVQELKGRSIPAAVIHSQQSSPEKKQALYHLQKNRLKLLYLSPETFLSQPIWDLLLKLGQDIQSIIIDEAHCLVQWGTTFRPIYRRLGAARQALKLNQKRPVTIGAFTATADPQTQKEISSVLQLNQPNTFRLSPYRANLDLKIHRVWTPRSRKLKLLSFIEQQGSSSGLVYTRSRKESETLAAWLRSKGYQTEPYHAGLSAIDRRRLEQRWLQGTLQFVICTCAFGMGINKPDVRWIVHFQPPFTLNEYIQEIGRAGRDGKRSQVVMLVSEPTGLLDNQDHQQRKYFDHQLQEHLRQAKNLSRRLPRQGHIPTVVSSYPHAEMSLSLLHGLGQLKWTDPMHYQIHASKYSGRSAVTGQPIQKMTDFIASKGCRWEYVLKSFGFANHLPRQGCGHCDRCTKKL